MTNKNKKEASKVTPKEETTPPLQPTTGKLLKGVDFYIENGYYVFTEHYLRARGYCCGSGCRHCPYEKEA